MWSCIKNWHFSRGMVRIIHSTVSGGRQEDYLKAAALPLLHFQACGERSADTGCPANPGRRWTSNTTSRFLWGDLEHLDWRLSPHRWSPSSALANRTQICIRGAHAGRKRHARHSWERVTSLPELMIFDLLEIPWNVPKFNLTRVFATAAFNLWFKFQYPWNNRKHQLWMVVTGLNGNINRIILVVSLSNRQGWGNHIIPWVVKPDWPSH